MQGVDKDHTHTSIGLPARAVPITCYHVRDERLDADVTTFSGVVRAYNS